MQHKFGLQVNNKTEADLIIAALEAYAASNPQSRTVIFNDMMNRLSILQNNLAKVEKLQNKMAQTNKQQEEIGKTKLPRGNPLPPISQKPGARQSTQMQQRNQQRGQQKSQNINFPRR